jgi:hypothetical protein
VESKIRTFPNARRSALVPFPPIQFLKKSPPKKQIDQLVYKLYDLTEEEKQIIRNYQ